jgi:hypothetical protein
VFEEGPYFFNSIGLHMRFWTERFAPEKEDFTAASVWIRMYSLPREFWEPEILEGIGNTIGSFVKIYEVTKATRYISYARICVYMNVANALPESIVVSYQDEEWIQPLDYEHIPLCCRKCHVHGHIFRDFPLNAPVQGNKAKEETDLEGFTKIQSKRKVGRHQPKHPIVVPTKNSTNNFKILEGEPNETCEEGNPKKQVTKTKQDKEAGEDLSKRQKTKIDPEKEATPEKEVVMKETQGSASDSEEEYDPDMHQDMELEEIAVDLPALRETHGAQKINNLTISQLRKLQRDLVKGKGEGSSQGLGETMSGNLGIKTNPLKAQKKISRRGKKERKETIPPKN